VIPLPAAYGQPYPPDIQAYCDEMIRAQETYEARHTCRHHYIVNSPEPGLPETGRCKRCGATRTFEHAPQFVTTAWGERRVSGMGVFRGRKVG